MEQETQKRPFQSLRTRAVIYTFACIAAMLAVNMILEMLLGVPTDISSHLGILAGGWLGWKCYRYENPGWHLSAQRFDFHWDVPLTVLLLEWSLCNLVSHLYGVIGSMLAYFSESKSVSPDSMPIADDLIPLILSVIIAPLGEELIFRQCGTGLLKCAGSNKLALLFPSVLFAVMHLNYGMQGIVQVFVGGMIYTLCFFYTENVLYSMLAHAAHNLMVSFRFTQIRGVFDYDQLQPISLITNLVMLAAGLFLLIRRVYPREIKPMRELNTRIAENTGENTE